MVGKITAILAKKEAEAYSSQGLHHEAITLYQDLLSASPNIDPAIKKAIQTQIQGLNDDMAATNAAKDGPLSHEEIKRIRRGWGTNATPTDILVCANAFYQVGSYADALEEYHHLLKTTGLKKAYIHGAADCLAGMHPPVKMTAEAVRMTQEVADEPKAALAALLAMAKHLACSTHRAHAVAVFDHLKQYSQYPALAKMADDYLSKLPVGDEAGDESTRRTSPAKSPWRFSLKWLKHLLSKKKADPIDSGE